MIGHQQFKKSFASGQNLAGLSFHFHSGFDRANAGSGKNACSGVDHAEAAYAHGGFILQVAQRWYRNAGYSRGVENTSPRSHGHGSAIDGDVDEPGR
jgi:hypothetical protein